MTMTNKKSTQHNRFNQAPHPPHTMKVRRMKWPTWAKKETESLPFLHTLISCTPKTRPTLVNRFKAFIKAKFPNTDFSKIVISFGKQKGNEGKAVALGPKGGETVIFKQDNTFTKAFSKQYSDALGSSAEEIIAEDRANLTDALRRVREAQILEDHLNKQAEREQQEEQERKQLETQLVQINDRIEKKENEGGTMIERQNENRQAKKGK